MTGIIDGKAIAQEIRAEVKQEIDMLKAQGQEVCLALVQVGHNPASDVYVRNKHRACQEVGINSLQILLEEDCSQKELLAVIAELNKRSDVDGILVQLPLPEQIEENVVIEAIDPSKDVDAFLPVNLGRLMIGQDSFLPCTPAGVIEMLKRSQIPLDGSNCLVLGRSNIVGKPMAQLLLRENATVTIAHSHSRNLFDLTRQADIIVAAIGRANFLKADAVKEGAVIIDVGINRLSNGKLAGDCDFEDLKNKVSAITPVPGGVGPMTIAMLLKNVLRAKKMRMS